MDPPGFKFRQFSLAIFVLNFNVFLAPSWRPSWPQKPAKGSQGVPKARPKPPLEALVAPFFELRARKADPSKMLAGPIQTQGREANGGTRQRPERRQARPRQTKAGQARPSEAKVTQQGQVRPQKGQAGEAKGGQERPQRPSRRGLEILGLFWPGLEANGRPERNNLLDFGGGQGSPHS